MFGAFLGDIIGSPYEFDMGNKSKNFPLFSDMSTFTDDSVMTAAVADALLDSIENGKLSDDSIGVLVASSLKEWGHKYPDAGYGGMFDNWLRSDSILPYNSFGNGSAMRVSSVGWLYDAIERTRAVARITAKVTHNHPEGIKGAEAIASAIFLARKRASKQEIKKYISENFGYNLSRTCDEIRPGYHHVETCQETVPEAIIAFLESDGFVDAIRNAVSLGGDCDTIACITGSIAEAFYGIPSELISECQERLPIDILFVANRIRSSI